MNKQELNAGAGVPFELVDTDADEAEVLRARIRELEAANAALRAAPADSEDETPAGVANASGSASKERFAIVVEEGTEPNADKTISPQINGRAYQIERGKRVEVPIEVIRVLEDAVVGKTIAVEDDRTGMPNGTITRPMRRFPFQNLGKVVDADGNRLDGALAA